MANKTIEFHKELTSTVSEMIETQQNQLLELGRRFIPTLTPEDMLQPNDYPELENNPHFRYEEGILAGLQSLQMAIQALEQDLDL